MGTSAKSDAQITKTITQTCLHWSFTPCPYVAIFALQVPCLWLVAQRIAQFKPGKYENSEIGREETT